jgi:serine protease Do
VNGRLPLLCPLAAVVLALGTACVPGGIDDPVPSQNVPGVIESTSPSTGGPAMNPQDLDDSVVFLKITVSGHVLDDGGGNGDPVRSDEVRAVGSCTGWVAGGGGEIVTAGHCVDPDEGRAAVIDAYRAGAEPIGGDGLKAEFEIRVEAGQPDIDGATIKDWVPVEVVDVVPYEQGNLALLRGPGRPASTPPPMEIAESGLQPGDRVTSIGFDGADADVSATSGIRAPSFAAGAVSARDVSPQGVTGYEVAADVSSGMAGGPTVDEWGRVVGVNTYVVRGGRRDFNIVTTTSELRGILARNGVG